MRTSCFILLLATLASCGQKTNELPRSKSINAFISEKAMVIPHAENGSAIRAKLLNKIVEKDYPVIEENLSNTIQTHDEIRNVNLSENELKDYELKEKKYTKVVVSYSDREEVYFVKDQIPVQDLALVLELRSEFDRKLTLVLNSHQKSYPGSVFYLVSVNHEDLMKNDQQFYSVESVAHNFQEKIYFENNKAYVIKVDYDFQVQALAPVVYTAPKIRCTRESIEDGSCGSGCNFTANLPVNKFEKVTPANLQDLGLVVKGAEVLNAKKGYFEMKIQSLESSDEEFFQVNKIPSAIYSGTSAHYNFSAGCSVEDRSKVSRYSQNTQVTMSYKVHVLGRGEVLKKIKL